jgi:glycosyltransferase involved in cell wall biosynthesis
MPTIDWPAISVIVNTHPEAHHMLGRALESVLAQTFTDYELIVVCDGPPNPETIEAVDSFNERFAEKGISGRLLATEDRFGSQAGPKNWAIYHSIGAYCAFLDADNEWTPDHLVVLYEAAREGEVWPDFTYARRRYVRDEGAPEKVGDTVLGEGDSPFVPWDGNALQRLCHSDATPLDNFIDTSDFLVSRGALYWKMSRTGWIWNEKHRRWGDWILMVEGVKFTGWRGKAVNRVLTTYHWHSSNIQHSRPNSEGVRAESVN